MHVLAFRGSHTRTRSKIKTQADEEEQLEMAERLKLGEQQAVDSAERRWPCCSR